MLNSHIILTCFKITKILNVSNTIQKLQNKPPETTGSVESLLESARIMTAHLLYAAPLLAMPGNGSGASLGEIVEMGTLVIEGLKV
jgi:hypothetical protein